MYRIITFPSFWFILAFSTLFLLILYIVYKVVCPKHAISVCLKKKKHLSCKHVPVRFMEHTCFVKLMKMFS